MRNRGRSIPDTLLHKLIGGLCISLPLVLTIGSLVSARTTSPGSLSGYYYTDMRGFFIGGLCALGAALLAHRGHERFDTLITAGAGASLIMVALCPTRPLAGSLHLTERQNVVGDLHDLFAIIASLALGVVALRLARARRRSDAAIHRACAVTIFSSTLFAVISSFVFISIDINHCTLLACEVLALLASGTSWLTCADDTPVTHRRMPQEVNA